MIEIDLKEVLEALPRVTASPEFGESVTRQAVLRATHRQSHNRAGLMFVLAAILLAGGVSNRIVAHRHQVRMHRLRAEHAALAGELEELKSSTPRNGVVALSVDNRDVVIDLTAAESSSAQRAATYEY
ncbi:MAG: hypothetical protein ABI718_05250 [Acidobacteriota bacterium]